MKKIILNEWTFVISVLTFIFTCFLSTGFSDDTFADIVINFFGVLLMFSLMVAVLFSDVSKKLQKVVLGFVILMLVISMSSCSSSRVRYGCTNSPYITRVKPDGYSMFRRN